VCYEAGPCGYGLYRQLIGNGHDCQVVAPTLIPRRASEKIKTDRRDSLRLAELLRAAELTPVWVPDAEQEAIRDLVRTRDDFKQFQRQARQQLLAFLLRHSKRWSGGKKNWTQIFWHWLEALQMPSAHQQFALKEYIDAVKRCDSQIRAIEKQMNLAKTGWALEPIVDGLMAMRGINVITAMGIVAELGDLSRFSKPTQLMAYLGLVPSEHSSGNSRRQGGITKSGNGHVRRLLIESAWCYRFSARKSRDIEQRARKTSLEVQAVAWQAQKRLCARYRTLSERGIARCKVVTAVARELCGFIWAVVQQARQTMIPAV
jgi:Transposase and inactivated derivatives